MQVRFHYLWLTYKITHPTPERIILKLLHYVGNIHHGSSLFFCGDDLW